jgi:branched-chain amino acid transport system substrate-binding protein
VPRTDLVLWGQTSNELARFVFEDGVWAVLSSIDSNHNHVLSRASLKAEVPVVSAGSTDPTLVEHSIPWLARCIPDDRQLSYALLHEVFEVRKLERIAMLRVNDRDGRVGVGEFVDGARRLGRPIVLEQRFEGGQTDFRESIDRIRESGADAIVLWGNPEETGAAVKKIRDAGIDLPLFGFDRMTQPAFLAAAGAAAEGIVVVATMNPDSSDPAWRSFRDRYRGRWSEEPDTYAAHAYDGMNLILRSIRSAGLNRARIRDGLFAIQKIDGVSGEIVFDTNMSDVAHVWLAVVDHGRYRYAAAPAWEKR